MINNENPLKEFAHETLRLINDFIIPNIIVSLVITVSALCIMSIVDCFILGGEHFEYVVFIAVLFYIILDVILLCGDYCD